MAFAVRRRRLSDGSRTRLVVTAAASYVTLYVLLVWEALRGLPIVAPDGLTMAAFAAWAFATVAAAWLVTNPPAPLQRPAVLL